MSQNARASCETSGCVWYTDHTDGIPHCDDAAHGSGTPIYCPPDFYWDSITQGCIGGGGGECDYDGVCDAGESPFSCGDCSAGITCNNNGICDGSETAAFCPLECGGGIGTVCTPNQYNDQTTSYSCSYSTCPNGCEWDNQGCAIGCSSVVTAVCGNNACESGETSYSCPSDCGSQIKSPQ